MVAGWLRFNIFNGFSVVAGWLRRLRNHGCGTVARTLPQPSSERPCEVGAARNLVAGDQFAPVLVHQRASAVVFVMIDKTKLEAFTLPALDADAPDARRGRGVIARERVAESIEKLLPERGRTRLRAAFGAAVSPLIVNQSNADVGEVGAVLRPALSGLPEFQLYADVGIWTLDARPEEHGIHLPLAGLGAVAFRLVVASVVQPQLSDLSARQ
jgi:hypothetical protein